MADIYGSQNEVLLQEGLADAIDKDDFKAKLVSFKPAWEVIAPGFHCWFQDNRSEIFIECLVLATKHSITQRFSTNALEAKHRLQKKTLNEEEVPKEIVSVTECLGKWVASYYTEERRAIRGIGKYRLAPEYEHFYAEPVQWVQCSHDRRNQHFTVFMRGRPKKFAYKKPKDAGKKPEATGKKTTCWVTTTTIIFRNT